MQERHSAALRYPVQRSWWLRGLWWCLVLLGGGILIAWALAGSGDGVACWMRWGGGAGVWLLCASCAEYGVRCQPQGDLHWSGLGWVWESDGQSLPLLGAPVVVLDLQSLLVLRWPGVERHRLCCVLQRDWSPHAWGDVRRAVYSSVHPPQDTSTLQVR